MSSPSPLCLRITQTHGDFWAHVLPPSGPLPKPSRCLVDSAPLLMPSSFWVYGFLGGMEALGVPGWGILFLLGHGHWHRELSEGLSLCQSLKVVVRTRQSREHPNPWRAGRAVASALREQGRVQVKDSKACRRKVCFTLAFHPSRQGPCGGGTAVPATFQSYQTTNPEPEPVSS